MDGQITVLLAGDTATQSTVLEEWLQRHHCRYRSADTFEKTCRLLSETEFDVVLCQYDLPDRTAFPLLDWLEGTHCTLMLSSPAVKGNRWLPVVEHGTRCMDRPLLQTLDLLSALGKMQGAKSAESAREKAMAGQNLQEVGRH